MAASAAVLLLSCRAFSAETGIDQGRAISTEVPDWPQWRGRRRDGISSEVGLLQEWPEGGPALLWTATGLGRGFGSPIIVEDSVYIGGDVGEDLVMVALDLAGKEKWRTSNGKRWTKSIPGGRTTPCYDDGHLYLMNAHGRLACLKAADGVELWAVNILELFEGKNITWGISESVLVDGGNVFATPVGAKGLMAAFDKKTGEALWTTPAIPGAKPTYSSPILVEVNGVRQLINCTNKDVFGVDVKTGAMLWKHPQALPSVIGMSPVFRDDSIYIGNTTRDEGKVFRLKIDGETPTVVWTQDLTDTECGNVVCIRDVVLGSRKRKFKEWLCLDAATGEIRHTEANMPSGSVMYADERFYCLTVQGTISLHELVGQKLKTVGKMEVVKGRKDVWAHPVVYGGRLYIRYHDKLHCYDVSRKTDG